MGDATRRRRWVPSISSNYTMSRFLVGERHRAVHGSGKLFTGMSSDKSTPGYCAECDLRLVSVEHAPGIISRLIRLTNQRGPYGILTGSLRDFGGRFRDARRIIFSIVRRFYNSSRNDDLNSLHITFFESLFNRDVYLSANMQLQYATL